MTTDAAHRKFHLALLASGAAILVWSGVVPRDRLTWVLEVMPAVVGGILLVATYRRFTFSTLVYVLAWFFAIILMVGGHWTYAEMPLGNWLRDALDLERNYYDRFGHFFQGFVPAIVAREVLLRTSPLKRGKWLFAVVVFTCLSVSALYELVEWSAAMLLGESAEQFLGTQGDPWDTQWDMFLALCGAVVAQLALAGLHDRSMRRVLTGAPPGPPDRPPGPTDGSRPAE